MTARWHNDCSQCSHFNCNGSLQQLRMHAHLSQQAPPESHSCMCNMHGHSHIADRSMHAALLKRMDP